MKRANSSHIGFSLIEVSISLALFALIITLVVVNVSFIYRPMVRTEVDRIYNICNYMRRCAMLSNKQQDVYFDIANNRYTFNGTVCTLPSQIMFGVIPGVKGPPSLPKKLVAKPITFKGSRISFFPEGIISSGTIYVTDRYKKFLYAISCSVSQVSYLRKYAFNDNKWVLIS